MFGSCGGHGGCSSSSTSSYGYGGGYGGGYGVGYGGSQGRGPGPGGSTSQKKTFPPPPGADPQLWSWFIAGDKDQPGSIRAHELQKALTKGDWTPLDLDTVRLLMGIYDVTRSGVILFNEFTSLWKYIKKWQRMFLRFDRERSGTIDGNELQTALNQLGYKHSPDLLKELEDKHDVKWSTPVAPAGGDQAAPARITFDRFVRACVVAKQAA